MLMFLSIIFFLAAFIFWVFLFIGLIKPSFVKMQNRKEVFKTFFIAGTFCFFVFALMVPATSDEDNSSKNEENIQNTTKEAVQPKPVEPVKKEWYEGATLHKATFKEWKSATDQNRLATAADFLAATTWKDALKKPSDFDKLKIKAAVLVKGINESVPEGSEFMKVHEIAAALVTLSNDLDPEK